MTRDNPLLQPLETLFRRLVMLMGLVDIVEEYLQGYRKFFISQFEKLGIEVGHAYAGFNLIVWDIAPPVGHERGHWRPVSSFSAGGDRFLELADLFVQREAAWTVSQAFEAFESYLKDLLAAYLASRPQDSQLISLRQPRESSNPASWRAGLNSARWNSVTLLASLRLVQPSIAPAEVTNARHIHLEEWHHVLKEVRHGATHSEMRIRSSRIAQWPPSRMRLLRREFPGDIENGDYVLRLTKEHAQSAIQMAADYAFLLFKCLSQRCRYDWDILRPPDSDSGA